MSLARSQWISLVAAALPTITAAVLWTTQIIPDGSRHWLAITATAIAGLLWSIAAHVLIVERCHRETRKYVEATINGLGECVAARILDESYNQVVGKILEHRDIAEEVGAANRNWRGLLNLDNAPVDLQQWRTERTADGTRR